MSLIVRLSIYVGSALNYSGYGGFVNSINQTKFSLANFSDCNSEFHHLFTMLRRHIYTRYIYDEQESKVNLCLL